MNIQAYSPVQTAYTQYPQQNNAYARPASSDNNYSAFSTDFTNISSMLSHAGGGGFASYKLGAQMATDMRSIVGNGFKGAFTGLKNTAITGLKALATVLWFQRVFLLSPTVLVLPLARLNLQKLWATWFLIP